MSDVEQYDASDEKQVEAAHKKAIQLETDRLNVIREIMSQRKSRRWMYGILEKCHIFTPSFTPGDSHITAFNEGERNVGNRLLADIMEASPDEYALMCKEGKE